ncbi:hypothetical protein VTH06DRAFT_4827, partial [Thermothelomyces fergusii]
QKARRLANAVLGREDGPAAGPAPSSTTTTAAASSSSSSGNKKVDADRVRSYVEQTRGKSLVEQHQEARAAGKAAKAAAARLGGEEEDDPSKRAFDWEKDMKVGARITNAQRRELLRRAANFGDRFQSGKFL